MLESDHGGPDHATILRLYDSRRGYKTDTSPHPRPPLVRRSPGRDNCGRIALLLQGGGALGSFQPGVYQALDEAGLELEWLSGISIGAVNAAIIAGNEPERRLAASSEFWDRVTDRTIWPYTPDGDIYRQTRNTFGAHHRAVRPAGPVQAPQDQSLVHAARRQGRHQLLRQQPS